MREGVTYGATLIVLLALDACFLGFVAIPQFKAALGDLLLPRPRIVPGVLFYLLYAAGLLWFVTLPGGGELGRIALRGALFGCIAYATYDLTNYATLRPWTLGLVVMDLIWGSLVSAAASAGGAWIARLITGAAAGSG